MISIFQTARTRSGSGRGWD